MRSAAARALLLKGASLSVSYLFIRTLADSLSSRDYGLVATLISGATLGAAVGSLGQPTALARFGGMTNETVRHGGPAAVIRSSLTLATVGCAAVAAAGALIVSSPWTGLDKSERIAVGCGLVLILLLGWSDSLSGVARSSGLLLLDIAPKELGWRLLAVIVLVSGSRTQAMGLGFAVATLATALALAVVMQGVGLVRRRPELSPQHHRPRTELPPPWRAATPYLALTTATSIGLANADIVAVGIFLGPTEAGGYFAANRVAAAAHTFLLSRNVVATPILSRAYDEGDLHTAQMHAGRTALMAVVPTTAAAIALGVLAEPVLRTMAIDPSSAANELRILLCGAVLSAALGPAALAMTMFGVERLQWRIQAITLPLVTILVIAGAQYGTVWVAAAVTAAANLSKLAMVVTLARATGLRTDIIYVARHPLMFRLPKSRNHQCKGLQE